jgi:hypothetical protein
MLLIFIFAYFGVGINAFVVPSFFISYALIKNKNNKNK